MPYNPYVVYTLRQQYLFTKKGNYMSITQEQYVEHEVRIRLQEQNSIDLKTSIKDNATELKNSMNELRKEVQDQFKWTLGIMITLFGGLIVTKFI